MRAFVTGSCGFIGQHITRKLLDKGIEVVSYDIFLRDMPEEVTSVEGDICDADFLREMVLNFEPDYVIHCAAIAGIDTVGKEPADTIETNAIGTWNVLSAASMLENLTRFVNFSTSEIYGADAFRVAEDSPASIGSVGKARWVYAASKLIGEHMTYAFHEQYGMPTVTVRPFNVYGPGQIGDSAMKTFIERAIDRKPLIVRGGEQVRCWCYIDDFIDGLVPLIFDEKAIGQTFNIGNEQAGLTISALACLVSETVRGDAHAIRHEEPLEADITYRVPDIRKMKKMFGYEPKIGLEEGIKRTEEWVRGEK